jgi:hypothetical protein
MELQINAGELTGTVSAESLISVLGVVYVHRKTSDGGDLYLTQFGLPNAQLLEIENWYEKKWFTRHRERLEGTSAVYKVPTRTINGKRLELVVKNCRVGEDVPLQTRTLIEFLNAEFNSPWEEFALVMEMREGKFGAPDITIRTQEPLAIYVPPEKMQLWQSGRSKAKIARIHAIHPGIDLDILRQYKLIYGWIKGENVVDALRVSGFKHEKLEERVKPLNEKVIMDLDKKGYAVADMKPVHIILGHDAIERLRTVGGESKALIRQHRLAMISALVESGDYAVIDYELLLRTPPHEKEVNYSRRHHYLDDQRDRFVSTPLPAYLKTAEVFDVPFIRGHVESTGGQLYVVGRNARLFDYFLPERWRKTPCWRLSENTEIYYTFTKDHVHIVWKPSRVGELPTVDPHDKHAAAIREYGYNSPFEEFAIAHFLGNNGVPTVYVRAIYMTGSEKVELSVDRRRYLSHQSLKNQFGGPILSEEHNYITVRGYFNGPDSWVAQQKGKLCRPMNLFVALVNGLITQEERHHFQDMVQQQLRNVGYDGLLLKSNDLLVAIDPDGAIVKNAEQQPEVRICNFELIRKL